MMKVEQDIMELIEYPKEGILSKNLIKGGDIDITLFCMAKGTDISTHTSTKAGSVYVLEGDGRFTLSGRDIRMKAGMHIYMERDAPHSLQAKEDTSFLLTLMR
ncbi:cupin [Candidatus Woesearchaeota archaeon CG11_big_fil_rev_8_21_14_0_20_43_8]|nr:MAG: cupin [Candidatus Woesearchaeota archaeon CG11_big_fil_rev_8_21_14_0_20_43_8]PIO05476.1 MAG: cupin domain-containing protein [Candidatus Woesearchaeota archaeon CG08_land_8_20_14_0_20_43_7]